MIKLVNMTLACSKSIRVFCGKKYFLVISAYKIIKQFQFNNVNKMTFLTFLNKIKS